jgi:hypothetical protein
MKNQVVEAPSLASWSINELIKHQVDETSSWSN